MKLLLDTHIWLWCLLEPDKLSRRVVKTLENPDNELWLSPISVWELLVLCEKKRVAMDGDAVQWAQAALQKIPLREAPLTYEIVLATQKLHLPHRDPADRFLIATAQIYDLTLITTDQRLIASKLVPILSNR